MVCVAEEETITCCVHKDTANDLSSGEHLNEAKIEINITNNVQFLIEAICKAFNLKEHEFELFMQRRKNNNLVMVPLSDSKQKLLKDIGVSFEKNTCSYFIIREVAASSDFNGSNNDTEDTVYKDNDDLLLGASASPTTFEGPQNLSICSSGAEDPLLISVLMRQDSIPFVGLVNQAMTCYLNSLLQALFMTPEFRNALYNWEFDGYESTKSIPYQLQKLFLNLQTSSKSAVETTELTRSFGWDMSEAWQQHDIQELCRVMFDALEQKFKDTDQADLINRLYQGRMIDYVKCLECKTEKSRVDTFLDIPLPVRPFGSVVAYGSVEEALRGFVQPETLDGNNQYFCDTCNKKCDAHKGLKFSHIPYLLTLHLKRFDFDYNVMHRIKLNDKVVFPGTLDLNSFVSSSTTLDEASESTTEEVSGVKCDDSSTTDSGSALDDESCHGTDIISGTISTAMNHHNHHHQHHHHHPHDDCQEDDEGIDVSSEKNEKNRRHNESSGPYLYELFAIMIHSGSASGGHYYAYIKDFRKGKWFCFDDQTVSMITYDDIRKTYGGGPSRTYYSGAYSSSTNAYMLMYRQIDPKRNVQAMSVDEFPSHIKKQLHNMREREEHDRITRERELHVNRLKVYVIHPHTNQMVELKLFLANEATLNEAVQEAFEKAKLENVVPIEQCRLVSYNKLQDSIERSYEGYESYFISDILSTMKCTIKTDWLLEIRSKDAEFMEYKPDGVNVKVYEINIDTEDVSGPIAVRGHEGQTCREFKRILSKLLNINEDSMHIAVETMINGKLEPRYLETDLHPVFTYVHMCSSFKIYVSNGLDEDPDKPFIISKFNKIIDKFEHIISLDVTLPVNDKAVLSLLSIPPLDVNQNCCEKMESGAGDQVATLTSTNVVNVSNKNASAKMSRIATTSSAAPVVPTLETEDLTTAHSDQSNSEDSSLSDSDRTLVGDAPDECLAQLSSTSNSPAASEQQLSSPESETWDEEMESVTPRRKAIKNDLIIDKSTEENWDDEEMVEPKRLPPNYYFKATEIPTEPTEHVGKILKVLVDKRMNLVKLKKELEPYVGVPVEYFKIFKQCTTQEIEFSRPTETLAMWRDGEKLLVKLGRVLKDTEFAGKVYQLSPNESEPVRFLCDWIVAKGMTVGHAKREILESVKKQYQIDIPFNRCRLRKKNWKNPNKVYLDDQKFVDDVTLHTNWEIYLQELPGPEIVTNTEQLLLFVRQWCPSTLELKPFEEVLLDGRTVVELKEKLSVLSGIPVENIEFTMLKGQFPYDLSVLGIQLEHNWNNAVTALTDWPFSCYDDGHTFLYRDNREPMKQLTSEERKEICNKESTRRGRLSRNMYSPRKERALKIYLDESPKKGSGSEFTETEQDDYPVN